MDAYGVAQICLNGHVVNDNSNEYPEHNEQFCSECSQPTITACPSCNASIRGHYHVPSVISARVMTKAPKYCHACGKPYPWTEEKLKATRDMIELDEQLNAEEKRDFKDILPDLATETPRSKLAVVKMKAFLQKSGAASVIRDFIIDLASETIKKMIAGQP